MELNKNIIGKRLKYYRKLKGLEQNDLANPLGITGQLSAYELGKRPLQSLIQITAFAEMLGIPRSYLISDDEIDKLIPFGQKLKYYMKINNVTRKEFADKLGITEEQVIFYEQSTSPISIERCTDFANILNIPVSCLLNTDNLVNISDLSFGQRLRFYRLEKGLTQKALSEKSGICDITIGLYEMNMVMERKYTNIKKIADALEISIEYLTNEKEKDVNNLPFGQKLKYYREMASITQEELALKCGIASTTISSYELGIIVPNVILISKFAEIIGIPPKVLTDSEEIPNNLFNFMD